MRARVNSFYVLYGPLGAVQPHNVPDHSTLWIDWLIVFSALFSYAYRRGCNGREYCVESADTRLKTSLFLRAFVFWTRRALLRTFSG